MESVNFYIKFIYKKVLVEYSISINIRSFLEENIQRNILRECLLINGAEIFVRDEHLTIKNLDRINKYLVNNFQTKVIFKMKNYFKEQISKYVQLKTFDTYLRLDK